MLVSDEERAGELRHGQALASDAQEELARGIQRLGIPALAGGTASEDQADIFGVFQAHAGAHEQL
ncbi:MAG TPA: hypothetical protein VFA45_22530 [Actinomycetes bacterium]|nr:hypothetical protein [Actinomycetes bacterium]